jgi:hypothetical protein
VEGHPFQVQWFERERLELHPEKPPPYDVLLGRLGVDRLSQQGRDWFAFPKGQPQEGCRYFDVTGHTVCPPFLNYWESHGLEFDGLQGTTADESLALFGLPISELQTEKLSDGNSYVVQWFERARFELHPENAPPYDILLGLLGSETLGQPSTTPTPVPVRSKITISEESLAKLADVLGKFGLSPKDVSVERTVTHTLPAVALVGSNSNAVLMLVAPLRTPPGDAGVLGVLQVERALQVGGGSLPEGIYVARMEHGEIHFIGADGQEPAPPVAADTQSLTGRLEQPQAVITRTSICFRWLDQQACSEPAPADALTNEEAQAIQGEMQQSVQALADKGMLDVSQVNLSGTLTDPEGDIAVKLRQASLIAAPAARFPSDNNNAPVDGMLIGVFDVVLDIDVPGYPHVPRGVYLVRAVRVGDNAWSGRLEPLDGNSITIPAKYIPAQPRLRQPQVEVVNIQILLCFFEC